MYPVFHSPEPWLLIYKNANSCAIQTGFVFKKCCFVLTSVHILASHKKKRNANPPPVSQT